MNTPPATPQFDVENFKAIYQTFDSNTLLRLPWVYSPDIAFRDPVHQLQGLAALKDYFEGFCKPDTQCSFVFLNQLVSSEQAFFQWQMHYRHPDLKQGAPLRLNGGSLIKFNSQIYYHEDFYDMGAMIYQHIPLLGWAVKKINARLASPQ